MNHAVGLGLDLGSCQIFTCHIFLSAVLQPRISEERKTFRNTPLKQEFNPCQILVTVFFPLVNLRSSYISTPRSFLTDDISTPVFLSASIQLSMHEARSSSNLFLSLFCVCFNPPVYTVIWFLQV